MAGPAAISFSGGLKAGTVAGGAIAGPPGAAIGAFVGGAVGLAVGLFATKKAYDIIKESNQKEKQK